jgi:DNA replication protein DnaC
MRDEADYVEKVATELNIERAEASKRIDWSGWNVFEQRREFESEGWQARLAAAYEKGFQEALAAGMKRVLASGPKALVGLDYEALRARVRDEKFRGFAETYWPDQGGRLLLGPTGVGKTVACVALFRRLIEEALRRDGRRLWYGSEERGSSFAWVRAYDLPNARLATRLGDGEADLVRTAGLARLLVLDDLGWESRRAGADDVVMEVLATRYDAGLPTIATSGMLLTALTDRYGEAVVRRITEAGGLPGRVIDRTKRTEARGG